MRCSATPSRRTAWCRRGRSRGTPAWPVPSIAVTPASGAPSSRPSRSHCCRPSLAASSRHSGTRSCPSSCRWPHGSASTPNARGITPCRSPAGRAVSCAGRSRCAEPHCEKKEPRVHGQPDREQMNIVVCGHVDHGKSTIVGRLLADTGSLPDGKLDQVRDLCARTSKPFEYAFLLDALKDERAQGITIDAARVFFKTARRDYLIIDAPGHVEFLKNMITGAASAEAAFLVVDAKEGLQENSRRHGYLLSFLGIRQVAVVINKMDLVDYDQAQFEG